MLLRQIKNTFYNLPVMSSMTSEDDTDSRRLGAPSVKRRAPTKRLGSDPWQSAPTVMCVTAWRTKPRPRFMTCLRQPADQSLTHHKVAQHGSCAQSGRVQVGPMVYILFRRCFIRSRSTDDFRPQSMELWQSEALRILFVQARWMPQQHGSSGFGYTAVPVARIYVPLMSLLQTVQGDDCPYCHLCRKGEIKRRKRKKIKELKAK